MRKISWMLLALLVLFTACNSPGKPSGPADSGFVTDYLTPVRIVFTSGPVENAENLLEPYVGQVSTDEPAYTTFKKGGYVVLDFGKEIQGSIQIVRNISGSKKVRFRLVLGESVSEALSSVDAPGTTATNDHAMRDMEISVPWLGVAE